MSELYPQPNVLDKGLATPCVSLRPVVDPKDRYTSLCCHRPFAKVRAWRQSILTSPLSLCQSLRSAVSTFETYIPLVRRLCGTCHLSHFPLSFINLHCQTLGHMTHPDQSQTSRPLATDRGIVVYTRLPALEKSGRVSPTFVYVCVRVCVRL